MGLPTKRHLNGVSLVGRSWPRDCMLAGLQIQYNTISLFNHDNNVTSMSFIILHTYFTFTTTTKWRVDFRKRKKDIQILYSPKITTCNQDEIHKLTHLFYYYKNNRTE